MRATLRGLFVAASFVLATACSAGDARHGFETSNGAPAGADDAGGSTDDRDASSPAPPPPTRMDGGAPMGQDAAAPPGVDAATPHDAAGPPPPVDASDGFDQFQHHNLDVINMYRATLSLTPLVLDQKLCDFALAGSQELSMDHMPHQHFIDASNDGTIWNDGFVGLAEENQGDPNGWTKLDPDPVKNELAQIDAIQKAMFDEGPGSGEAHGHYENMMNAQVRRLGVGLLEVGGELYLTNDFSE